MAWSFARGAQTINPFNWFFKPMMRKSYHRKSASNESARESVKSDAEEVKKKSFMGENEDGNCWIPHEKTGIFYPKGKEKVMEDVPVGAGKDYSMVNWFSHHDDN